MARAVLPVPDSLGIGALPDAAGYGDAGADTLGHIALRCATGFADQGRKGQLQIPHLQRLGLAEAARLIAGQLPAGCDAVPCSSAAWPAAREFSFGKDTTTGHRELAGQPTTTPWGSFGRGESRVPVDLLDALKQECELSGWLGNCGASGTAIIDAHGDGHRRTGKPIIYTSADSVLHIAANEADFGLERLYRLCAAARRRVDSLRIGRVIARPFLGLRSGAYRGTTNRRDFSMPPHRPSLLDALTEASVPVLGVGKIADILAHRGITEDVHAHGNDGLFDAALAALERAGGKAPIFTNSVDSDSEFAHRRDVAGYASTLEHFDTRLPELLCRLREGDLLVLCADHGNDPTWPGNDDTREHIPVLLRGGGLRSGSHGIRSSFADTGQTLARHIGLPAMACATAFENAT